MEEGIEMINGHPKNKIKIIQKERKKKEYLKKGCKQHYFYAQCRSNLLTLITSI